MKNLIIAVSMHLLCITTNYAVNVSPEEQQIIQLFQSDDWIERERATSMTMKHLEEYQHNGSVKHEALDALIMENEHLRFLAKNKLIRPEEEGRGEYALELIALVIKLDIPEATEALLDCAGTGGAVADEMVKRLQQDPEMTILRSLHAKLVSSDLFYKGQRSSYMRMIGKYLEQTPQMDVAKRAIIKEIVLSGLQIEGHFSRLTAIQCSRYFPDDADILHALQQLAETDAYYRDDLKTFPVRDEAAKALKTFPQHRENE